MNDKEEKDFKINGQRLVDLCTMPETLKFVSLKTWSEREKSIILVNIWRNNNKNSPNMKKDINLWIQEVQSTHKHCFIIKLFKTKDKVLKETREKYSSTYSATMIWMPILLVRKIWTLEGSRTTVLKCWEKKKELYLMQKYPP